MTKKILLFVMVFTLTFLLGCEILTQTTTLSTTSSSTSTETSATNSLTTTTTTNSSSTTISTVDAADQSYINLFDNQVYKKFVIHFSIANFMKLIDDMQNYYDEFGSYRDNTIQEVDIEYTDNLGNTIVMNEVGFRTKGNIFTRKLPVTLDSHGNITGYQQVSFQLEFNDTFDYPVNSTQYKDLKDRRGFDLEQLNFKYVANDDFAVVSESVSYELFRKAGVVTSATSFAIIYFDIEGTVVPYGLFMLQEPIDDVFVKRYFGRNQDGSIGDLYKCVWQTEPASLKPGFLGYSLGVSNYLDGYRKTYQLKTNKLTSNFSSFTSFIDKLNATNVVNYKNVLEQSLDIDSLLRAYAIGFLVGNPDDYRSNANNYYLFFYEGIAIYIPFDMDHSLGHGWNPYGDFGLTLDVLNYQPVSSWIGTKEDLPMAYNILQIEEYKDAYLTYLIEFTNPTNGIFDYQDFFQQFALIKSLYEMEVRDYGHLGVSTFSTLQRYMNPGDYYDLKAENTRSGALGYLND